MAAIQNFESKGCRHILYAYCPIVHALNITYSTGCNGQLGDYECHVDTQYVRLLCIITCSRGQRFDPVMG